MKDASHTNDNDSIDYDHIKYEKQRRAQCQWVELLNELIL
jgi:hypothetical protein